MTETSIIIRTFNEERHLPGLIDAIRRQGYRDYEIIVVDSGSFDRTRDIAEERQVQVVRIAKHDFTFGYSLNTGIRAAKGKYIVMVSAHTEPVTEDWLAELVAPLRDDDVAMSYGRQLGVRASKFSEAEDFRRIFGTRSFDLRPPNFFANNANSAVRRDLWEKYPFDETLTGLEDIDFAKHWMNEGYRVRYVAEAPIYHIHEETWQQVYNRYYREAVAARRIGVRGRRHLPAEGIRELGWGLADLTRCLVGANNPAAARMSPWQRMVEVVRFRARKFYGAVHGFMEPHPMETREEQEHYLFDRGARSVRILGPGKAVLEETEVPGVKPGEALIRVAHVAVCATDLEIANGTLGYYKTGMAQYPITPGHEFSGRVARVGQNVSNLKKGDPVVVECIQSCGNCGECKRGNFIGCGERTELGVFRRDGAYADYVSVPAQFVHKVPADVELAKAALAEPTAVILKGMRRLCAALEDVDPGTARIGVVGAGPLGHLCAKVVAQQGYSVVSFDRSPERLAFLDGTGIETSVGFDRLAECGVVIELTGNPDALDTVLRASPAGAAILLLGLPYGEKAFSFETLAAFDKTVIGSVGSTAEDFAAALRLLPKLDLGDHLSHRFELEAFEDAWRASKSPDVLKAIIEVDARGG